MFCSPLNRLDFVVAVFLKHFCYALLCEGLLLFDVFLMCVLCFLVCCQICLFLFGNSGSDKMRLQNGWIQTTPDCQTIAVGKFKYQIVDF